MQLSNVLSVLSELAPLHLAESWDNVGLLLGDPQQDIRKAMLCIDYSSAVAAEARQQDADLVIAYHPPIFHPLKRLVAGSLVYDAARRGLAIYSPHTALDVADGGTNDVLADAVGLAWRRPLRLVNPKANQCKLVVFVPESHVQAVSQALFEAGAGRIGNYSSCSFRSPGTGTFKGESGSNPTIGQAGQLETVNEVRLETVLPLADIEQVLAAMRKVHPYEEPAFDLVELAAPPQLKGLGRIGELATPAPRARLLERIKQQLELNHLLVAGPTAGTVHKAAVCAGACGDLLDEALAQKVDLYLTGEMRHHDALRAAEAGVTVVCALHSNSERAVLKHLAHRLADRLPQLPVHLSSADRDPFMIQ